MPFYDVTVAFTVEADTGDAARMRVEELIDTGDMYASESYEVLSAATLETEL